jgi:hypothetical protein
MAELKDFNDSYSVYTHGAGTHNIAVKPFQTKLSEFTTFGSTPIRTDEYKKEHNAKHILFAGCSVTHGIGIPDPEDIWTNIVYNKIKETENVSGFYSVAYPAHSITMQVSMIMRYISEYSKPDVIFFNLPSSARTFVSHDGELFLAQIAIQHEKEMPGSMLLAEHTNFESYLTLHEYCRVSGIKLISLTWSENIQSSDPGVTKDMLKGKFDSFYIGKGDIVEFLAEYQMNNKTDYPLSGTDGQHPGLAFHAHYASIALDAYLDIPA